MMQLFYLHDDAQIGAFYYQMLNKPWGEVYIVQHPIQVIVLAGKKYTCTCEITIT